MYEYIPMVNVWPSIINPGLSLPVKHIIAILVRAEQDQLSIALETLEN